MIRSNFNTTLVTVYPVLSSLFRKSFISIQLLLLFISAYSTIPCHPLLISIQLLLLFITECPMQPSWDIYFNTTLVTVYLLDSPGVCNLFPRFQYNSCYCLSGTGKTLKLIQFYFNTTLVTVYQKKTRL